MLKLLVVDDHVIFREGLRAVLEMEEDFEVIGEASQASDALPLVQKESPDIILLDLHLPDGKGSDLCRELLQISPSSKVLILSAYDSDEEITASLVAGASGYVLKTVDVERLAENIRSVHRGEVLLAPPIAAKVVQLLSRLSEKTTHSADALAILTAREHEVFELAGRGLRNSEIAAELFLSEKTIKTHLRNIYNKLELSSKAELRLFAQRMDLSAGKGS
jgi:two-component system NarL family response regulator